MTLTCMLIVSANHNQMIPEFKYVLVSECLHTAAPRYEGKEHTCTDTAVTLVINIVGTAYQPRGVLPSLLFTIGLASGNQTQPSSAYQVATNKAAAASVKSWQIIEENTLFLFVSVTGPSAACAERQLCAAEISPRQV